MKFLMLIGEILLAIVIAILTIPLLIIGFFVGLPGMSRYVRVKSM